MNDTGPLEDLKRESSKKGKDTRTRRTLIVLVILWLLTLGLLLAVSWNAYFSQRDKAQTLAQQVAIACDEGVFSPSESHDLCENAENVIDGGTIVKQGPEGPQGPPGVDGTDGTDGTDGQPGAPGKNGKNGLDGSDGNNGPPGTNGSNGTNGSDGLNGEQGPQGPQGEKGEKGDKGDPGEPGQPGANAFPFTFTFTIPGFGPFDGATYVCTVTDPSATTTCQEAA